MKKIFVTGASGYIAKHIILQLLQAGYAVRGSVRSDMREAELRAAMTNALGQDPGDALEIVQLDLNSDDGWAEVLQGSDALFHTASPFVLNDPKDENELIKPAVDGTLRALRAAKETGIKRVVLTSSVAAILGAEKRAGQEHLDEEDWTDPNAQGLSTYNKSKTLAEMAAWEYVKANDIDLTTINPSLVLGAPVDDIHAASLSLVERFMRGKDPMVPHLGLAVVHVKDVAKAHIKAFENDASIGHRVIAANEWYWFKDMTTILKNAFPERKIPTRQAPNFVVKLLGLFDKTIRANLLQLSRNASVSNAKAKSMLGMEFIAGQDAIVESGQYLDRVMEN